MYLVLNVMVTSTLSLQTLPSRENTVTDCKTMSCKLYNCTVVHAGIHHIEKMNHHTCSAVYSEPHDCIAHSTRLARQGHVFPATVPGNRYRKYAV
jgi:hypothetical protein